MPAKLSRGFASLFFRASSICAQTFVRNVSSSRRTSASGFFGGSGGNSIGGASTTTFSTFFTSFVSGSTANSRRSRSASFRLYSSSSARFAA